MTLPTLNFKPFYRTLARFCQYGLLVLFWLCAVQIEAQDLVPQVAESLKANVVAIKTTFDDGSSEKGFGFITGEEKGKLYLATAAHVVRGVDLDKKPTNIQVKFFKDIRWLDASYVYHWDQDDLALLEMKKPEFALWRSDCADFSPQNLQKVRFIGLNGADPSWVYPGSGEIFELPGNTIQFAIGTIRPGCSGAPLIGEKGILGLILKDDSGTSTALKLARIKELFSGSGQYPYFSMQLPGGGGIATDPGNDQPKSTQIPLEDEYGLVSVLGGTFTMGCTSEQGSECESDENPAHQVTLNDFYIGKYEVTQAQWRAVMGSNPSTFSGCDQCPVERVSWDEVQEFLRKLNAKTGKKYRLPTEAEWEYAARGGNQSKNYKYAGSNTLGEVAWYWYTDNADSKTHPVGQKKANELGLYDLSGNVLEWCQDWKGDYSNSAQSNPTGAGSGSFRVLRGGGWNGRAGFCRVSYRNYNTPTNRNNYWGFRLAL